MSSERFIKFIPSEKSEWLLLNHPNAFLLLSLIAMRARRKSGHIDGLKIGEALIGDYESCGLTRDKYRTALDVLIRHKFVEKVETCRTRKPIKSFNFHDFAIKTKSLPTAITTVGTKVKLLDSGVWDINLEEGPHRNPHRSPTGAPPEPHEQEVSKESSMSSLFNAHARDDKIIYFKSGKPEKAVVSLKEDEAYKKLNKEGYSNDEIKQAIEIAKESTKKIHNPVAYIKKIIENKRHENKKGNKNEPAIKQKSNGKKERIIHAIPTEEQSLVARGN
jgi:hypothetical protein